ncbi:MAG: hypothetical protein LBP60_06065 [Spirochaetaceae bacterium]|jgi:hypothetical protein|nr:hypothetical protein [Spirochaetaceae bacterium]
MTGKDTRRDLLITAAWIGAAILAGALIWVLTQPYRSKLLIEAVNRILAQEGDGRRLEAPLEPGSLLGLGRWFSVEGSGDRALVFTVIGEGGFAACIALTGNSGQVKLVAPLSHGASQIMKKLPLPVYRFYLSRIERAAALEFGRSR